MIDGNIVINVVYVIVLIFCLTMILLPPSKMPNMDKKLSEEEMKKRARGSKLFYLFLFILNFAALMAKIFIYS
ncbi:MAG: hypothetical protein IJ736_16855 [Firmicutes bacterium]|nr:hypothetical protein [Bacillota bacterium]